MQLPHYPQYGDYKDSGFDWIKSVPSHWTVSKLGSCLSPVSKKNHGDKPLLSITREAGVIERDVEDQDSNHNFIPDDLSNYKLVRAGQFAMNKMKAWQGSYGVSEHTGIVSPAYYVFDFAKPFHPRFFNIAIRSKLYVSYFGSASDGVRIGQWDLNKMRMKAIPFLVPPIEEQEKIARFLDEKTAKIDQAIKIKEAQIALLKGRKQIIIQEAVTKGLDPNAAMKDSGIDWIGDVPADWETKRLKFLLDSSTGYAFPSQAFRSEGIPVVRIGDLSDTGIVDLSRAVKLPHNYLNFVNGFGVEAGDILMAMTGGTIGKVSLYEEETTALLNQRVCKFSARPNFYTRLALYWTKTGYWKKYIDFHADGGAQPNISDTTVLEMKIPVPLDLSEQAAIVSHLDARCAPINDAISLKERQIETLKEYKATLINAAVTGKIKVI